MADETQNAPVAGAQTATQGEQKTVPFIYYYSDPDEADQLLHHLPIPSFIDLSQQIAAGKLWHIYNIPAPDKDMEDPVIDVRTNTWVENSKNAQTKVLAEAQAKIEELDQKSEQLDQANDKVDQAVKTMQLVQAQSSQQNVALMKSFTQQAQNTNKMLATMQQTLAMVVKSTQKDATPEAPKADDKADQASDTKQENGGN
ncbi:hypothetical protein DM469_00540 [Lactobacillus helveticus]|uniref:hypothetical protein n=1 Tax=Lactobacillus helveticus TaxID=1587 RepID=UPI000D7BD227|nr:hypothetical protein [Lactobacillus helveticus]PXZ24296.1 hypothetical protein DM468_00850 [Lactobacillus helveticus]PXZ27620.1 hypothetical protein DM472_00540 [Lactobacillus helveticus]PXZ31423.1 hypothetical protein DM467_00540 [Lactobacillus helveticus]PXZ36198.1 hypothetical protein DM469_00540 [Lactobacillus helveticus]PXZ37772.1 hypothetical protein DM466_00540 [Lactobacillus helveticus]